MKWVSTAAYKEFVLYAQYACMRDYTTYHNNQMLSKPLCVLCLCCADMPTAIVCYIRTTHAMQVDAADCHHHTRQLPIDRYAACRRWQLVYRAVVSSLLGQAECDALWTGEYCHAMTLLTAQLH